MDILTRTPSTISRLKVLFFHLVWTARHRGIGAAARFLGRRLGFRKTANRVGCSGAEINPGELTAAISLLAEAPRFTIIVLDGGKPEALQITLDSIEAQIYPPYQVFLVTNQEGIFSGQLADRTSRFGLQIYPSGNPDLLRAVDGDYISVVYIGDSLTADALGQVAISAGSAQDAALIYADDGHRQPAGQSGQPVFKPDWSPDFLLATDYIARAVFFKKEWVEKAGGLRQPIGRASLYDMVLRISEIGPRPLHIPRILYTRSDEPSDDSEGEALAESIQAALNRRGVTGEVTPLANHPGFCVPRIRPPEGIRISILIATHDQPELLQNCLTSIFTLTRHNLYEVVLVDHQSRMAETSVVIDNWRAKEPHRFRCLPYTGEFNFSKINNFAADQATGDFLLLLNNDTEVAAPDWLDMMAGYTALPTSGAVGAVLEYPNGRIQHGGIVMGVDDLAVHAFKDMPVNAAGYMGRLLVPSNFSALTGACLMVRAEVYHALGGLDEDYSVAGGDIDFCLRIAQKGMYNILLPHVRLIHHESATRGFEDSYPKFARLKKELDLLSQRWPDYVSRDPYYHPCLDGKGRFTTQA